MSNPVHDDVNGLKDLSESAREDGRISKIGSRQNKAAAALSRATQLGFIINDNVSARSFSLKPSDEERFCPEAGIMLIHPRSQRLDILVVQTLAKCRTNASC